MPPKSFLKRVTKYSARPRLDASENRLTEITAGVLEHVDGFAQALVEAMLTFALDDIQAAAQVAEGTQSKRLTERVRELKDLLTEVGSTTYVPQIRTQVGTAKGRFVDLEIRLRRDIIRHELDLLFWVEVKHGAPVHGDQLEAYEIEIPRNGMVVVVAPLQSMPDVPPHMPLIPWQRLADVVRHRCRCEPEGSSARFILDAYADYLKEENLMDDALTPVHALALEHHTAGQALLARLCQAADQEVERRWAPRGDRYSWGGKPRYGPEWSSVYPLQSRHAEAEAPGTWRESMMDWGLQDDGGRHEDARHQLAFVAGASMRENNPVVEDDNAGWVSELRAKGFYVYQGNYRRVWAFLYPEQLLAETTIEGQAGVLADWVVEKFELLASKPPPH